MAGFRQWLYTWFPSSLELIIHLDTDVDTYTVIYEKKLCGSWSNVGDIHKNGYYLFKVWNQQYVSFDYIVLRYDHVVKATGCTRIFSLSSNEFVRNLTEYVKQNVCNKPYAILGIFVDDKDKYMEIYPFLRSMYVLENATPHMINLLYSWISCKTCTYRDIQITDYNYQPYKLSYNQFLFANDKSV